ncbi:hypothetical protein niasHT_010821 [Heterodera trifolii]|uniref:Methyltransferase domain-containing protein n=1 Tax=Heterodera trifolii TaxID=157864 RepID=A0ABD2KVC5_9BILA
MTTTNSISNNYTGEVSKIEKRQQTMRNDPFGQRYLRDECAVFDYNAWDDVNWPEEKKAEIHQTIQAQLADAVPESVSLTIFHGPEMAVTGILGTVRSAKGQSKINVLDVGCGMGNTTIPLLQSAEHLFMYSCDFSKKAIETLRNDQRISSERCRPFVWDITENAHQTEVADGTLDFVLCIFVLRFALLRPGGMLLLKDYGRHDLTQLRFKSGRLIQHIVPPRGRHSHLLLHHRGMDELFREAGLEKIQNFMDKRLVVNRAKRVKMYRRWIQCKYVKRN